MKKNYLLLVLSILGMTAVAQKSLLSPTEVKKPIYFDISPPLRDMNNLKDFKVDLSWKDGVVKNHFNNRHHNAEDIPATGFVDKSRQDRFGTLNTDTTIENFEGLAGGSYIPPDTYGDVGPNHYFQVVNCTYAVYNKAGTCILGPIPSSYVWNGMPYNTNSGDAVVVYDETADRWLFSQFSLPFYPNGPFYQMIAVSQTPDPTGSWYRYMYSFSTMPDYPKFGVWEDGYYMSCNRFGPGNAGYDGTGAAAFDRNLMLAGNPTAQMVWFALPSSNEAYSMLPSDCDGDLPPAGTPNYFTYEYDATPYHLGINEFHVDWENTANSTFGNFLSVPVNSFNSYLNGIPQLGTGAVLGTLSDRLMYRLQFRKFSDHWSMVCNHSVNVGSNVAGIRWYELRKTTGTWGVYQQATYAPADNNCRWMGSMAMDTAGNIALGYSISSPNMYPSIRYTGRLHTDPLNQMTISERQIMNGSGCQYSSSNRWGDYSSLTVDPASPTTFWYTTEYYPVSSESSWHTRIASFTFGNVFSTDAAASPVKICQGDTVQLTAIAYGGSGSYTYSWTSIPPGFNSNISNPKVEPNDTINYVVTISDGTQTHHDTAHVNVLLEPSGFAGNDTIVNSFSTSIALHGIASNYHYTGWSSTGNGHFSDIHLLNPTYTFGTHDHAVDSVDLQLVVFANSPCMGKIISTRHIKMNPYTGIPENSAPDQSVTLEPNPATTFLTVVMKGLGNSPVLLSLSNTSGQTLYSEQLPASGHTATKQLNIENLPSGVYFIQVRTTNRILTKKLVIEK
jgi:hypothetical protein